MHPIAARKPAYPRLALLLGALIALFVVAGAPAGAQEPAPASATPAEPTTLYLPMLRGGSAPAEQPQNPGNPPVDPQPVANSAHFFSTQVKTNDADIAVDAAGGVHVAFKTFVAEVEHPAAYYGYCANTPAGSCATEAGWRYVSFGDRVDQVELALSPAGQPRIFFRMRDEATTSYNHVYVACDADCVGDGAWSGLIVLRAAVSNVFDKDNPQRAFALDPQGRPRFVYTSAWGAGKPVGVFYVHCDSDCADPNLAQWVETRILPDVEYKSETLDYPSLAFTSDGSPRVLGVMGLSGDDHGLHYLACDSGCDDLSGWTSTRLAERGGGVYAGWDLELDAQDRPRAVQFQGSLSAGDPGRLFFLACDAGCTSADAWQRLAIAAPGIGINPDLELTATGAPRLAYGGQPTTGTLLAYAWCETACAADASQWRAKTVESAATLDASFKPAIPFACNEQSWAEAIPTLSLDVAGNPRIAYDALNAAMCYYDLGPGNGTGYRVEKIWRAARFVAFAQP